MTEDAAGRSEIEPTAGTAVWMVRNKIDLATAKLVSGRGASDPHVRTAGIAFMISARQGEGISELIAALTTFVRNYFGSEEEGLIGRERQRKLLQETAAALRSSLNVVADGEEVVAWELRIASQSLGRLLGRVDVEDVLDKIFQEFCIGK
jgi:tRNA modification GTPase